MIIIGDKRNNPYSRLKVIFIVILFINDFCPVLSAVNIEQLTNYSSILKAGETKCENGNEKMENYFTWADYLVLGSMLVISCGIGLFYGFIGSEHKSSDDFLLGGSSMGTFPMAMSLAASFVTAIELLGNPAEMYYHGTQFLVICCAFILVIPLTSRLYLPVFMKLRLTSSYEYFSMRFNEKTRYLASGLFIFQMVLYTSVAVYAPALALSNVTGLNVYLAVTVVYVVCIFYASQGGMKAVIIADTFQTGVLIGSIILLIYLGEKLVGDMGIIWSQNYRTDRLEIFNLDPNPTIRHSFWSVILGGTFYWMTMFCSNQASIQKYLSVERISQVRKALWTSCFGLILIYTMNFYMGMILVANYKDCDPLESGKIHGSDEILPLFVLSELGHYKGITGFFVAGIFAASLGTVASALNSLAAVTIQDFVMGAMKIPIKDSQGAFWAKCISIIYGALSFALVFIVAQLGSIMQVAISFNGMIGGVTLGLFSLGMFFPWANSKGAIFASIVAVALISTMCIGQQISIAKGDLTENHKPISVENCPCSNVSYFETPQTANSVLNFSQEPQVFFLYRVSYIWYSALGFLITVILGLIVSFITGAENPANINSDLLSPPVLNFLDSLSNNTKEALKIPLKQNVNNQNICMKGILNIALDISEENGAKEVKELNINEYFKEKVRKISAPT